MRITHISILFTFFLGSSRCLFSAHWTGTCLLLASCCVAGGQGSAVTPQLVPGQCAQTPRGPKLRVRLPPGPAALVWPSLLPDAALRRSLGVCRGDRQPPRKSPTGWLVPGWWWQCSTGLGGRGWWPLTQHQAAGGEGWAELPRPGSENSASTCLKEGQEAFQQLLRWG